MAVRITLECGHVSMLRAHKTPEGYTHDWEVFVRGVDHADIHYYIEKVVFHLHQTFPKPKRTLKEPPYVVKESGYAGFVIPIDVYLKNKDDPKKLQILYDLQLQPSGPAINNVTRHTETISNPSDEFRRKLLKGGAVAISSSESGQEKGESKSSTMVGKPKLGGGDSKKHRFTEPKMLNHFADLFGEPIKPATISPDNKKTVQSGKSTTSKPSIVIDKADKTEKNAKIKDSPHKDKRDKVDEKKDKKIKDQSRERNRSKDKSKRSSSPGSKSHASPSTKRPSSPVAVKKAISPIPPAKRSASPKPKEKDAKRPCLEKDKEKEREKINKDTSKNTLDSSKSEKKKDKKHKEDREKERKDKYKERERTTTKEAPKVSEKKSEKIEKSEKQEKEKSQDSRSSKDVRKSPKPSKESEKSSKDEKPSKIEKQEKVEKTEKPKDGKSDKDRQKHKHKKKDKKEKRDSSKEREKKEKREKSKSGNEKQSSAHNVPQANPLTTLLAEIPERDSSDSAPSVDEDSFLEPKPLVKKEPDEVPVPTMDPPKPHSPTIPSHEIKKEKSDKSKRDKPKGSRSEERESRKRKRRSESKCDEDRSAVKKEKERDPSASPLLEPVSSSQSPVAADNEIVLPTKEKEERNAAEQVVKRENEAEQVAPDSTNSTLAETDLVEPPVFSEDYVSQLRDLQHKIMTLQDNQELQRVVQVIAETGQYEITKKTFDFDLCALDRRTVQRLQQFFSAS